VELKDDEGGGWERVFTEELQVGGESGFGERINCGGGARQREGRALVGGGKKRVRKLGTGTSKRCRP